MNGADEPRRLDDGKPKGGVMVDVNTALLEKDGEFELLPHGSGGLDADRLQARETAPDRSVAIASVQQDVLSVCWGGATLHNPVNRLAV